MPLLQRLFRRDNRRPTDIETVETERPVDRWLPSNLTLCEEGAKGASLCARGEIDGQTVIRVSAKNANDKYLKTFRDEYALCYMWDEVFVDGRCVDGGWVCLSGVWYVQKTLDDEYKWGRLSEPALVNRMLARRLLKFGRLNVVATDFFWAKKDPALGTHRWLNSCRPYPHT